MTNKASGETQHQPAAPVTREARPPLWPFSDARAALTLALLTVLVLALFNRFPAVDIAASEFFFQPVDCADATAATRCGSFPAASSPFLNTLRDTLHALPPALAAILLVYALIAGFSPSRPRVVHARGAATAVLSLVVCSLGLVNFVLKEYSGRPRPLFTDLFGGTYPFVEAGRFSEHCDTNCSFVSGESSAAFWLLCLVPLVPRGWRWPAAIAALLAASTAAGLRMAFGAHYLSDVTVAALLSLTVFSVLATLCARLGWYRMP